MALVRKCEADPCRSALVEIVASLEGTVLGCCGGILGRPHPRGTVTHAFTLCSRSAFAITDAELRLIASAAIIGDNNQPVTGYSSPAASGTPSAL